MRLIPSAREPIATARIVWDLDPGIATVPQSSDLWTWSFINRNPQKQKIKDIGNSKKKDYNAIFEKLLKKRKKM